MSDRTKLLAAVGVGILLLAGGAFFLLGNRDGGGGLIDVLDRTPKCPLTGIETENEARVERPAVAIKIANSPVAYPLSGLENAEVVYEELVEGGLTRFMAIYHCTDAQKAGPVRSARLVDPAIMSPITRILAASGGIKRVEDALKESDIVFVHEDTAGNAMQRVPREGLSLEHTLYANTKALRKLGAKKYEETPRDDLFAFGDLEGKSVRARTITIDFGGPATVSYQWSADGWKRFDGGEPLMSEAGEQITVDNVLIEEHNVIYSDIVDPSGAQSVEIEDVTGSGRAVLFRDGRAIRGRWERDSEDDPVRFVTKAGDEMVLAAGTTWIELVPSKKGEAKGSFSFARR